MSTSIQRSPLTSGPGIGGGFGAGTVGAGVAVGSGVGVAVAVTVGVSVVVGVGVTVGVAVGVAVGAANTFHEADGPNAWSEYAVPASATAASAAAAARRTVLPRFTLSPHDALLTPPDQVNAADGRRLTASRPDIAKGTTHAPPPHEFELPEIGYFALPILNIVVPQTGHLPFVAGLPFFIVVASAFDISCCFLHFKQ